LKAAVEFLEKRGNGQRVYRNNALVFLAADKTRMTELHDPCAQYRAWKSIHDEREQLGLDPFNAKLAEKKVGDFDNTVDARLPETFQWLLVPEQPDTRGKTEWQPIRLSGSGSLAARAFTRLGRDGLITGTLAGTFLRHHLDKVLWSDRDHLDVRQVQEYFAQYLYLPRLTYKELVIDEIRDGNASLTWQLDTFADAGGYDEQNKRYVGLQAGCTGVAVVADGRSVIVKPDIARAQIDKESAAPKDSPDETTGAGAADELFGPTRAGAGTKPGTPHPHPVPQDFTPAPPKTSCCLHLPQCVKDCSMRCLRSGSDKSIWPEETCLPLPAKTHRVRSACDAARNRLQNADYLSLGHFEQIPNDTL
jgi:hypothetical protein